MVATTARQRYTGDRTPVAVKQTTREEPGAHLEHAGAESRTRGAMETRFDVHSGHGGASFDDGGALATVLDKMRNQPVIEHHRNKADLVVH